MLTNYELLEIAKDLRVPLEGVYSKDLLSKTKPRPGCGYIVNLVGSDDGFGSHWVSFVVNKNGTSTYFDSFGVGPPTDVLEFLRSSKPVEYNCKQVQGVDQGFCGYFCVAFLWFVLVRHGSLKGFVNLFTSDNDHPDNLKILRALLLPL